MLRRQPLTHVPAFVLVLRSAQLLLDSPSRNPQKPKVSIATTCRCAPFVSFHTALSVARGSLGAEHAVLHSPAQALVSPPHSCTRSRRSRRRKNKR